VQYFSFQLDSFVATHFDNIDAIFVVLFFREIVQKKTEFLRFDFCLRKTNER